MRRTALRTVGDFERIPATNTTPTAPTNTASHATSLTIAFMEGLRSDLCSRVALRAMSRQWRRVGDRVGVDDEVHSLVDVFRLARSLDDDGLVVLRHLEDVADGDHRPGEHRAGDAL